MSSKQVTPGPLTTIRLALAIYFPDAFGTRLLRKQAQTGNPTHTLACGRRTALDIPAGGHLATGKLNMPYQPGLHLWGNKRVSCPAKFNTINRLSPKKYRAGATRVPEHCTQLPAHFSKSKQDLHTTATIQQAITQIPHTPLLVVPALRFHLFAAPAAFPPSSPSPLNCCCCFSLQFYSSLYCFSTAFRYHHLLLLLPFHLPHHPPPPAAAVASPPRFQLPS